MTLDKKALRLAAEKLVEMQAVPGSIPVGWAGWKESMEFLLQVTPGGVLYLLDELDALRGAKIDASNQAHDSAVDLERADEDYSALYAEVVKLRETAADLGERVRAYRELRQYHDALRESVGHASWGLVANELRALRKVQAERDECREAIAAVADEIPYRITSKGNAPGHSHSEPGVWDSDNGELAGKPCAWCRVWALAKSMSGGKA